MYRTVNVGILIIIMTLGLLGCNSNVQPSVATDEVQCEALIQQANNKVDVAESILASGGCDQAYMAGHELVNAQEIFREVSDLNCSQDIKSQAQGFEEISNTQYCHLIKDSYKSKCCWAMRVIVLYLEDNPHEDGPSRPMLKQAQKDYAQACQPEKMLTSVAGQRLAMIF
jgi:hypothetical protein